MPGLQLSSALTTTLLCGFLSTPKCQEDQEWVPPTGRCPGLATLTGPLSRGYRIPAQAS